jgi:hypothetical protein
LMPCLQTLHIYTFMTTNLMMRNLMKMTLNDGSPKFLGRPTWGSNYVEMRKELELGAVPNFQH